MAEKWFEFVKRIKKEGNYASLSEAMKAASERKSEWKKGPSTGPAVSSKKTKKTRKSKKSKKSKKSRKSRKSRKH